VARQYSIRAGVVGVVTHAEMPGLRAVPTPPLASQFVPMQGDEVRHQGQPVAAVLAETLEAAERGAELVEVRYEPSRFAAETGGGITIHFVEEFDRHASPIGAKGIGELAPTGVDAAVAEAVFQATGRRVRKLPITPDKLL
jgi:CO/xanthine dehydrogenase Mo-binding subunit